jgi:hypothetical protein
VIETDAGSSAPQRSYAEQVRPQRGSAAAQPRLELPMAVSELLAIVRYITAANGPLQMMPESGSSLSPWHKRLVVKGLERLEVIDTFLRGRVAFFMVVKDHGYGFFDGDLELARAALANCRATTVVVEALLAGRLPAEGEFDSMSDTVLRIYPAIEAI